MAYKRPKFSQSDGSDFFNVLRSKVNGNFGHEGQSKYGNWNMVFKTVTMFVIYIVPYILIVSGVVTHPALLFALWIVMGLGMSGIGLCVMHDASHDAYSPKRWINHYLGYTMNIIGANVAIWKIQHNQLHHTYTNIHGSDDDINSPVILRLSPYDKRYAIHKYQYVYAWLLYGFYTLVKATYEEYTQAFRYKKMGLIKGRRKLVTTLAQLSIWKVFYYAYMLVIPMIFSPAPVLLTVLSFLAMHFVAGFILSLIFQTAHVMPSCKYTVPDEEGKIDRSWAINEMLSTSNYAPSSRIFSWLIGGLNYQIEHHLFPQICHVHYKKVSGIVSETAKEYNIPYNVKHNFLSAVWDHAKMLYMLGRQDAYADKVMVKVKK